MRKRRRPDWVHCPLCKSLYQELRRDDMPGFVTKRCPTCRSELSIPKKMLEEG
jgi:hypothetical protein